MAKKDDKTAGPARFDEEMRRRVNVAIELKARMDALEAKYDAARAAVVERLEELQQSDAHVPEGNVTKVVTRSFAVKDLDVLLKRLTRKHLGSILKVNAAFYDAAEKAGIDLTDAVQVESKTSVKIAASRSENERARMRAIAEATAATAEAEVATLVEEILKGKTDAPAASLFGD